MLAACGGNSDYSQSSEDKADIAVEEDSSGQTATFSSETSNQANKTETHSKKEETGTEEIKVENASDRKVIYTADSISRLKIIKKQSITSSRVEKYDGYVVDSSMYEDQENGLKNGQITVRVPQEKFQTFIKLVEEGSSKVLESTTSGEDVTEEYVDLESRLTSKRTVEKRLLSFMEDAKKTEDLLQISSDLADVQEEIEAITGRMKYIENKSDLATVTIYLAENNVQLSGTGKDKLNTWDKTKQQFMKSINFLITAFSSVFIFLVGNLPIIILAGGVVLVIVFIIRKAIRKKG